MFQDITQAPLLPPHSRLFFRGMGRVRELALITCRVTGMGLFASLGEAIRERMCHVEAPKTAKPPESVSGPS